MFAITKNPPVSSYYGALIGVVAGWSERAWHLGFLLPAFAVVLGTYRLAERFPHSADRRRGHAVRSGFLVSATGVMCDVMMLAYGFGPSFSGWTEWIQQRRCISRQAAC